MYKYFLFTIGMLTVFLSCKKDDITIGGTDYSKGTYIVNEGLFQNGTGTITFVNGSDTIQDVFARENNGTPLGNIAQSMIKFDNKYYISINNGAKILVVDAKSFRTIKEISGIDVPRFFAADRSKLYVSAWGKDFNSGTVSEIDAKSNTIISQIVTGGAPEKMMIKNNKLYVTMSNSNQLIIIDINTNKIINSLTVGDAPVGLVADKNGSIWVICWGYTDYSDPRNNTLGSLYKLDNDQVKNNFILPYSANNIIIDKAGENLFFLANDKLYMHGIDDITFRQRTIFNGYYYGMAYDVAENRIFLADAADFQSPGKTLIITPSGKQVATFRTGIVPGFFFFSE